MPTIGPRRRSGIPTSEAFGSATVGENLPPDPLRMLGINYTPMWTNPSGQDKVLAYIEAAGIPAIRLDLRWNHLEQSGPTISGTYATRNDYFMDACAALGVRVLGVVHGTPAWAGGVNGSGGDNIAPAVGFYDEFAGFAARCATRWSHAMDAIEIWNEPNLSQFWTGNGNGGCLGDFSGTRTPTLYPDMLIACYPAIKAAVPNMKVVCAGSFSAQYNGPLGLANDWRCTTYYNNLYAYGAKDYFDVLGIHSYPQHVSQRAGGATTPNQPWYDADTPSLSILGMAEEVLAKMTAEGDGDKEMWFTEFGYNTVAGSGNNSCTEAQQATKYAELGADFAAQPWPTNITRLYPYNLIDGAAEGNAEQSWGLINLTDGDYPNFAAAGSLAPKPAWATYAGLTKTGA